MKKAFVTGITGQDGGYLAELLVDRGYEVHALRRRSSHDNLQRIAHLKDKVHLHYGDLTETGSFMALFQKHQFEEVYNLAAQSHVRVSFDIPEYTADVDGMGTLRILECIRTLGLMEHTRFYQASTSELYGKVNETPQNEETPFYPRSPYGIAKQFSYWMVRNYREGYGLHGSNGILFNHESPWRGDDFVTQKVVKGAIAVSKGEQDKLSLGNLDAQRDWGHAKDYVEAMYLMVQQPKGDDYVVASGKLNSVRHMVETCFNHVDMKIHWEGEGVDEKGYNDKGKVVVDVNSNFFRPTEVELLLGDATKARTVLNWKPKYTFETMIEEMLKNAC